MAEVPARGRLEFLSLRLRRRRGRRCDARRCGDATRHSTRRFCSTHEWALLELHGGAEERLMARRRLELLTAPEARLARSWALSHDVAGGVLLVPADYVPPARDELTLLGQPERPVCRDPEVQRVVDGAWLG